MKSDKSLKQEPTIFLSRKLWQFSEGRRKTILLYVAMFTISNLILLLPPLLFGKFIREIQEGGLEMGNLNYLLFLLFLFFMTEVVFWAFHGPARVIERYIAFWAEVNYRKHLLNGVLALGLTWHSEHDSGDTIDRVNKAAEGLSNFGKNVFQIIQIVVKLLGTSVVLYLFSPWIGISVFLFVLISFAVIFQFDRYLVPQYRRLNEFSNRAMAGVFDALSNVTSIKILHIEKPVLGGVLSRFTAPYRLYQDNSKLNEGKWFVGGVLFQAIAVVPIAFYVYSAVSSGETLDAGTVSTLYLYLSNLMFVYFGFTDFYQEMTIQKNRVLNAKSIEDAFTAQNALRRDVTSTWKTLQIQDLSFAYSSEKGLPHLDAISMQIQHGERIAVIGESGSGKTTFLKVLHGLYPTAEGGVVFDESKRLATSFADIDLKTMLVPQEPELFSSSIRENITLGIEYSEEEIMHAARIANFEKIIAELPNGLESNINEKGVNLSGGQKQRLALTRALLFAKDKEIILLDESTSSVDSENETQIYNNIWQNFAGKTVIASIHKMNLLKLFDRIYIFDKGQIADSGSFDELLEGNSTFKESWEQFVATNQSST